MKYTGYRSETGYRKAFYTSRTGQMKKVLFILLIVICIVQPVRTQECTVTETESAGLAYQTLRWGLADTQSRSLAASAIGTTLGALPPPTVDIAGSMQLWQLYKWGAGID